MELPDGLITLRECVTAHFGCRLPVDEGSEFSEFLDRVLVIRNKTTAQVDDLKPSPGLSFDELVDLCRVALIKSGNPTNSLADGYKLGDSNSASVSPHTPFTNLGNNILKQHTWRHLHGILRPESMSALLTQYSAFDQVGPNFVQLFGNPLRKANYQVVKRNYYSLDLAMYKESHTAKFLNPFPSDSTTLLYTIFKDEFQNITSTNKVPQRLQPFKKLADRILENHARCRYIQIADEICPLPSIKTDEYLDLAFDKRQVIRFVIVVFEKIFPPELYGGSQNKSMIIRRFSKLLTGEKGTKLMMEDCVKGLNLKDIPWLGKQYAGNLNKQDTEKRQRLLRQFVHWLFSTYLVKLLGSFFHITHISSGKELYFFRHATWTRISRPYLEKYLSENLKLIDTPVSISQAENSEVLESRLRVMPKKNKDFRVINVPQRGRHRNETFHYLDHLMKEIRPAKRILNQLRLRRPSPFPKLSSVSQVAYHIGRFKLSLIEKHGEVPGLFFLKFDARACYDSLPQEKIMESVSRLVEKDEPYYYCEENSLELGSMKMEPSRQVGPLKKMVELKTKNKPGTFLAGPRKQHTLKGSEIMDICKTQLEQTITRIGSLKFLRTKGVFQGLHLSSLFCDLVYDSLIENEFQFLADTNTLILRIADDFLMISDEVHLLMKMQKLANRGFPEYGVTINKLKTSVNFGSQGQAHAPEGTFTFCGYDIDLTTLDVIKQYTTDMALIPYVRSHRTAASRMLSIYKIRLKQNTLDTDFSSPENVTHQIKCLAENVAHSYYRTTRPLVLSISGFRELIHDILELTMSSLRGNHGLDVRYRDRVKTVILDAFLSQLMKSRAKYEQCIEFLLHEVI